MNIGKTIGLIQSIYSKGVESDDSRLSSRHIYTKLISIRQRIVLQDLRNNSVWSKWILQYIENLPLRKIDSNFKNCSSLYKSIDKIPEYASDKLIFVSNVTGEVDFDKVEFNTVDRFLSGKYSNNLPFFYIMGGYLYVGNTKLKVITLSGIWKDPIKAWRLHEKYNEETTSCIIPNKEIDFFTPDSVVDAITDIALKSLISPFMQSVEDTTNNNTDDLPQQSK